MDPNTKPPVQIQPAADRGYRSLSRRANNTAKVVALLFAILAVGSGLGYFIAQVSKNDAKKKLPAPEVKNLTADELSKLSNLGSNLGTSNQLLTVAANAQFNNSVLINKDLSLSGKLNANGPVTINTLTITGSGTSINGLQDPGILNVAGATTLQNGATINGLLSVLGNLAVSGTGNFNTVSATTVNVRNLSLSGPLVVSHIQTQGQLPSSSTGGAAGGGGTTSLSGNDTAGTININIGAGAGSGVLMTVTFRAAYSGNVRVLLSPLTGAAASAAVYVTRSATGFQVRTDLPLTPGSILSFDYFIVQ